MATAHSTDRTHIDVPRYARATAVGPDDDNDGGDNDDDDDDDDDDKHNRSHLCAVGTDERRRRAVASVAPPPSPRTDVASERARVAAAGRIRSAPVPDESRRRRLARAVVSW